MHGVFVAVEAAPFGAGVKPIEIAALNIGEPPGDCVKRLVVRRMRDDSCDAASGVGIALDLEARAVPLRAKAPEINARLSANAAAHQRHGSGFQCDAKHAADGFEIGIDRSPPVVIEMACSIPFACLLPGGVREFIEGEDLGFNNHRHGGFLPSPMDKGLQFAPRR